MNSEEKIFKNLKKIRKNLKLTQNKMAEITKINEKYYGRLERNESIPTIKVLNKISKGLEVEFPIIYYGNFENTTDIKILNIILKGLKKNIGIHINRDNILEECENIIWYNGFLGSINIDEFELKIYAYGEIKGKLYIDYNKRILNKKKGNVFFLESINSIIIKCFNNNLENRENEIYEEILDNKDNIIDVFNDIDMLAAYCFEMKK